MRLTRTEYEIMQARLEKIGVSQGDSTTKPAPAVQTPRVELRQTTDEAKLNKTERAFYEVLIRRTAWVKPHAITLKLADDTRYTPDFFGLEEGTLTAWETKGYMRDDARVKLAVAARSFPVFRFVLVRRNGDGWDEVEVKP